jgi:hypothetical protein
MQLYLFLLSDESRVLKLTETLQKSIKTAPCFVGQNNGAYSIIVEEFHRGLRKHSGVDK